MNYYNRRSITVLTIAALAIIVWLTGSSIEMIAFIGYMSLAVIIISLSTLEGPHYFGFGMKKRNALS